MKRAVDEFHRSSRESAVLAGEKAPGRKPSNPASFLFLLDAGRKSVLEAQGNGNEGDRTSQKYHFLRLLNEYQGRCNAEGRYLLAKEFAEDELRLRKEEEERQVEEVKRRHNHNRSMIVAAHAQQEEDYRESE